MINNIVVEQEIEKPIRVDEFRAFVLSLLERYKRSLETKEFLRQKRGITQILVDEMLPLSILTEYGNVNGDLFVKIYPLRNTSYDAELISKTNEIVERFEITMAVEGQQELIRMEHLGKYGHAPGYGDIKYTGNRRNRKITETPTLGVTVSEHDKKMYSLIVSAFRKKAEKKEVYNNMSLLIGIECEAMLSDKFWAELKNTLNNEDGPFNCVYIADIQYLIISKFMGTKGTSVKV